MACSLALVLALFGQNAPAAAEAGKLSVLIGTIETKGPADADYRPLSAGAPVEDGAWIRSSEKSKGIIDLLDGTEIRINEKTELMVEKARRMELKIGQIYMRVAQGSPYLIKTPHVPIDMTPGVVDISYNPNDPHFAVDPNKPITMIHTFEGKATIRSRKYTEWCPVGHFVFLVGGVCHTPERSKDKVLISTWVHDVLLARTPRPTELRQRADRLTEMLLDAGNTKLTEAALRSIGEAAVPSVAPILKISPKDPLNVEPRRRGARLIAEVGGMSAAKELRAMIDDTDEEIRVLGAQGLARLAGQNFGYDERYWRGKQVKAGLDAWDRWLKEKASK